MTTYESGHVRRYPVKPLLKTPALSSYYGIWAGSLHIISPWKEKVNKSAKNKFTKIYKTAKKSLGELLKKQKRTFGGDVFIYRENKK